MGREILQIILRYEKARVELRPFAQSIETLKGLSKYATCLGFKTPDRFISFLEGKAILDVSSGSDGFAIEIILEGVNCNIVANNLSRRNGDFKQNRLSKVLEHEDFQQYPQNLIGKAIQFIDKTATDYFAQVLPLASGSFDAVIDVNGVFYYAQLKEVAQLYKAMVNMYRVTN